jgi:hypothetical protein
MALREWWRKQPRWKWLLLAIALLIAIGIPIKAITNLEAPIARRE